MGASERPGFVIDSDDTTSNYRRRSNGLTPESLLLLLRPGTKTVSCESLRGLHFNKLSHEGRPGLILDVKASHVRANRAKRRRLAELDPNTDISDAGLTSEILRECSDEVAAATPDAVMSSIAPALHLREALPHPEPESGMGRRLQQTSASSSGTQQWGLSAIRASGAWDLGAAGSASVPTCVIDTGVQVAHPAIVSRKEYNARHCSGLHFLVHRGAQGESLNACFSCLPFPPHKPLHHPH